METEHESIRNFDEGASKREPLKDIEDVINSCQNKIFQNKLDYSVGMRPDFYEPIISELSQSVEELVESSEIRDKFEIVREVLIKKKERIADLEEALKGSIKLSLEREMVLQREEERSKKILEKVCSKYFK